MNDKQLFRLSCNNNSSLKSRQVGFVGDPAETLELWCYVDADFAGDRADLTSTSGVFLVLVGPHTFYPLCYSGKKTNLSIPLNA